MFADLLKKLCVLVLQKFCFFYNAEFFEISILIIFIFLLISFVICFKIVEMTLRGTHQSAEKFIKTGLFEFIKALKFPFLFYLF